MQRVEVIKRRSQYEENPSDFSEKWSGESKIADEIISAIKQYKSVSVDDSILHAIAIRSVNAGVDGLQK